MNTQTKNTDKDIHETANNTLNISQDTWYNEDVILGNQSLVDLDLLDRGQDYDELSPCYIIFICSVDLFHAGYHVYEFRNTCIQDPNIPLEDGATKVFLNAKGVIGDISPELKEFLDYVAGKEKEDPSELITKIKGALNHAKQNREWRRERMIMYFHDMDIREEALKEGRTEGLAEGHAPGLIVKLY